jgi:hypothetical protein
MKTWQQQDKCHNGQPHRAEPWLLVLSFLLLCGLSTALWAQAQGSLNARVDRLTVGDTESFNLILELRDVEAEGIPDLSALQQDFHILQNRTQTSMQLDGSGNTMRSTQFVVTLQAKEVGRITIPAIQLGAYSSDPITITVTNAPSTHNQAAQDSISIELDAEPTTDGTLYVQAQLSLIVRLYYPGGLTQGSLNHPEIENAVVELLDEVQYTAQRGGQNVNVLERRYAVQPERSGTLIIPAMRFDGRLSRGGRRSFFGISGGRRVRAASEAMRFEVQSQPASFSGQQWLPARRMEFTLEQDKTEVRVGDPVNRNIAIQAQGLSHTQLPELPEIEFAGGRIYASGGEGVTNSHDRWMVAQRSFQQAIVPTAAGTLTIPDTQIVWWNVVTNQEEVMIIPGTEINVLPALVDETASPVANQDFSQPDTDNTPSSATAAPAYWHWTNIVLALLWLITLALWWRERQRQPRSSQSSPQTPQINARAATKALKNACLVNDAEAARNALIQWGQTRWPQARIQHVQSVAKAIDHDDIRREIQALQASSFAAEQSPWEGARLWQLIEQLPAAGSQSANHNKSVLPALYPE